jgi:hypothetical protein
MAYRSAASDLGIEDAWSTSLEDLDDDYDGMRNTDMFEAVEERLNEWRSEAAKASPAKSLGPRKRKGTNGHAKRREYLPEWATPPATIDEALGMVADVWASY